MLVQQQAKLMLFATVTNFKCGTMQRLWGNYTQSCYLLRNNTKLATNVNLSYCGAQIYFMDNNRAVFKAVKPIP